jgi:hypothetical protein
MRGSAPFCWLAGALFSSSSSSSPFSFFLSFFVAVITFVSLRYSQLLPPSDPTPPSFFFSDPFHPTFFIEMNKLKSGKDPSILSQWST